MKAQVFIEKVESLVDQINTIKNEFDDILNEWPGARDETGANDQMKELVDKALMKLETAKNSLCALNGGRRKNSRKHRRRQTRRL